MPKNIAETAVDGGHGFGYSGADTCKPRYEEHATKAARITWCIVVSLSLACITHGSPDVDAHVANLTSEDAKVAEEARHYLEAKGADVVPVLFDKLLVADWTLRPRLLEVLSKHGREFAKQKLLAGNETEKTFAGLVYELTRAGQPDDYDTPEFAAMVEALLKAIKSDDKTLRAAAEQALQGMEQCVGPGGLSA